MDSRDEENPLVVDSLLIRTPKNHTRDVHILSCAFLLIFLAYGAAQNLETTVNTEGNLGTISLGILYLSFTFFSLFSSLVVRLLGSKNAIVLGTTGYWLFVAANLKPSWLYNGASFCVSWLCCFNNMGWTGAKGTYLTSTARSHARDHNLHEGTIIGKFNGEFWGVFASHQLVGNLISLALLRNGTGGTTSGTTLLFIVFLISMTLGTILMCFLSKDDGKGEKGSADASVNFYSYVVSLSKSVIAPLFDIKMILIIPLIAYSGLQQAFVWAEFTKEIVTPTLGAPGVGGAMAMYGAFDALVSKRSRNNFCNFFQCSLAAGQLTSGLSSITYIVFGGALVQAVVFLWLLLKYSVTGGILGIIYPLLMAAILGIGDGVLNTQLSALIGILFKHDTEGAFAQLKVWQCASIAIVFFVTPYISLQTMLVIMLAAIGVSLVGVLFLTIKVEKVFFSSSL
ncbi:hypothetical protein Pint_35452 [Pistacia integerrima]|uniref:Uncharacterized protein n=1 Tax=Pistacia integerrima TaxID=434235 RepID=A0ACC0Y3N7_9ROSI|nr:hypothetical protein Pint_35452 [Pistacia integerrima]